VGVKNHSLQNFKKKSQNHSLQNHSLQTFSNARDRNQKTTNQIDSFDLKTYKNGD
jgi:hypothetical protein